MDVGLAVGWWQILLNAVIYKAMVKLAGGGGCELLKKQTYVGRRVVCATKTSLVLLTFF